jgi:hypothetical protein
MRMISAKMNSTWKLLLRPIVTKNHITEGRSIQNTNYLAIEHRLAIRINLVLRKKVLFSKLVEHTIQKMYVRERYLLLLRAEHYSCIVETYC